MRATYRLCLLVLAPILLVLTACQSTSLTPRYDDKPDYLEMWDGRIFVRLESSIIENGLPVRLHLILNKPKGEGPFPLLVLNHGSTGRGRNPDKFRMMYHPENFMQFFVARGWMVAQPFRRGRGWSDGLYDEGFGIPRSHGYTCETGRSMAGLRRALTDIEAAMELLMARPDVDSSRIVMSGISRGGILSVAYAGQHPNEIDGVINFVGGWLGDACSTARTINHRTARMGGPFPQPMLWMYGGQDDYYSLSHSQGIFRHFKRHGGHGTFVPFPDATHSLVYDPWRWRQHVNAYMTSLGFNEFSDRNF